SRRGGTRRDGGGGAQAAAASRFRRAGRGGDRSRGVPRFVSSPRPSERPQATTPHAEPCRPDSADEHLARARAASMPVLSASESLALLCSHRRRDALPPEPPCQRRRPHLDPRANGLRQSTIVGLLMAQFFRYPGAQVFLFDKDYSAYVLAHACGAEYYDIAGDDEHGLAFTPLAAIDRSHERRWAQEWIEVLLDLQGITPAPA